MKALYGDQNPSSASDVIEGRLIEIGLRAPQRSPRPNLRQPALNQARQHHIDVLDTSVAGAKGQPRHRTARRTPARRHQGPKAQNSEPDHL